MAKAAFIIKGPPTYLNAEEAKYQFGYSKEQSQLFIVIPSGNPHRRKERLNQVIDAEMWDRIHWIETQSNTTFRETANGYYEKIRTPDLARIQSYRSDARKLADVARSAGAFDVAFTVPNDVHEHLAWCLRPNHLHLLDTGNKTPARVTRTGYIDYRQSTNRIKRFAQIIGGLRVTDRQRTSLFTAYPDLAESKHSIVANTYALQRQRFCNKGLADILVWIGGPFVDRFGVDIDNYIAYIQAATERLALKRPGISTSQLVYIPHPGKESERTLTAIQQALNCQIDDRLLPVELKLAQMDCVPAVIASHFSSSLTNLAAVLDERVIITSAWHPEFGHFRNLTDWRSKLEASHSAVQFLDMTGCSSLLGIGDPQAGGAPGFQNLYAYRDHDVTRSNHH